jgi:hypothetical protein
MKRYKLRSLGKQPLPGERQGTSGASAGCDSGRAASDASLNRLARIGSPENSTAENNNPDTHQYKPQHPLKVLCHRLRWQPLKRENQGCA